MAKKRGRGLYRRDEEGRGRRGIDGGGDGNDGRGKRELEEDVAQLVRPIHVPMKRLRRTDVVKREENYYDYYY